MPATSDLSRSQAGAELIAEQLAHTLDLISLENKALRLELEHQRQLNQQRLSELESQAQDFEIRIRSLQDSATTFKTWSGLANGGSSVLALLALVRTFTGQ